uniref:Uncharacterized protein ycf23 n=1 Tax=Dasyclonium flaccidum TaxID=2007274 RepID=A0A1Z1MKF8_9FLOR|nr:hypothetical protein [Dasyclonium flaccidum]ARW66580.1 hypothetical protein [Dasyclonium flaccidum]
MTLFNNQLYSAFKSKQVVKVIAGLDNNNVSQIIRVVKAAELSNATYIDIIANSNIVNTLKSCSCLPVCVSSINPLDLYNCVIAGADLVEIGNFDIFYKQKIYLNSRQILDLAQETRLLVGDNINICVTIPYYLHLSEQIKLAEDLESLGINILQTESLIVKKSNIHYLSQDYIFDSTNISASSLSSTYAISNSVNIPVITSSGINCLSSSIALFYGASGIGVGSAVNNQLSIYSMLLYIKKLRQSMLSNEVFTSKKAFSNLQLILKDVKQFTY